MQYTVTTNMGVDVTARWTGRAIEVSAHPKGSLLIEWAGTQDRAISIFNKFVDKYTNKEQVKMDTNEPGVTVAVEEPLSDLTRIRLNLEALEEMECKMHPGSSDAEWLRFQAIQDKVYESITDDLRTLINNLDGRQNRIESLIAERDNQRKELEALKAITDSITKMTSKGGEWNGYNGDNLLAQLSIDVEGLGKS